MARARARPASTARCRSRAPPRELADLLGAARRARAASCSATPPRPTSRRCSAPEADEVLFPRGVQLELRQIFQLLGDRIAKHVGVNLRPYGVTRGDRLRAKDNPIAAVAQSVATGLGFGEIDVYISSAPAVRDGRRADEPGLARDRQRDRAAPVATRSGSPPAARSSSRRRRSRSRRGCRSTISACWSSRCCACSSPTSRPRARRRTRSRRRSRSCAG